MSPIVRDALQAVAGLARGRSAARESERVRPVPQAFVDAVKPFVSSQVWTMIELQRFTGMRPGEVTAMRTTDLDIGGTGGSIRSPNTKIPGGVMSGRSTLARGLKRCSGRGYVPICRHSCFSLARQWRKNVPNERRHVRLLGRAVTQWEAIESVRPRNHRASATARVATTKPSGLLAGKQALSPGILTSYGTTRPLGYARSLGSTSPASYLVIARRGSSPHRQVYRDCLSAHLSAFAAR